MKMKMKNSICFVAIISFFLFLSPILTTAHEIEQGTIFRTTNSSCDYYMSNNFSIDEIIVYSTSLYFSDGNITTYPSSGWLNMSLESLESSVDFTNNVTIANLTIDNGFASFTMINGDTYYIRYQSNDVIFQDATAYNNRIVFTNIPTGSWRLISAPVIMKDILISKHVETTKTSYVLLGILAIVSLVSFIFVVLYAIQTGDEINFTTILMGFVMLLGFFILLYIMIPLFDSLINTMGG